MKAILLVLFVLNTENGDVQVFRKGPFPDAPTCATEMANDMAWFQKAYPELDRGALAAACLEVPFGAKVGQPV